MPEYCAGDTKVGLLYESGLPSLDCPDLATAASSLLTALETEEPSADTKMLAVNYADEGGYSGVWFTGEPYLFDRKAGVPASVKVSRAFEQVTLDEAADAARKGGVTWVLPTAHCKRTVELAELAERIGSHVNYLSPEAVAGFEDKGDFYDTLRDAGEFVPEIRRCNTAEDIARALHAIGKVCVLKTSGGHSSLGLKTIDGSRELTQEDWREIIDHVTLRDALGLQAEGSIVQEFFGDAEWGVEVMFEVSREGIEIVWDTSTRKIVLARYGRRVAHIQDPEDQERVEITQDVLLPAARRTLEAVLCKTPDRYRRAVGRHVLNLDVRTEGGVRYSVPDASGRWAPGFIEFGNAGLGLPARDPTFHRLARQWARGEAVPPESFKLAADATPRAAVIGKAFTATGGTVVHAYNQYLWHDDTPDNVFGLRSAFPGAVLPGPGEAGDSADVDVFPSIGVNASTIQAAQELWRATLRDMGLVVERDNRLYSSDDEQSFTDYYRTASAT